MGNEALFLTNDNWNVGRTFVAGDQQGCDFNLVDLHRFNYVELDGIRNFRQQKSHWFRAAFKLNRRKAKQRVRLLYVQFSKYANGIRSGH